MAGRQRTRAKQRARGECVCPARDCPQHPNPLALITAVNDTPPPELPKFVPPPGSKSGDREWMLALTEHRKIVGALDPAKAGGRARTKLNRAEIEERALMKLVPKALKVLEAQLDSDDERVQQAAARDVLDRAKGKAAQTIKQTGEQVHTVRYESAAWTYGSGEADEDVA